MKIEEILKKVNSDIEHAETLLKRGEKILDAIDALQPQEKCFYCNDQRRGNTACLVHNCKRENGMMICYRGKCKPEDYPLPKDYPKSTSSKNAAISDVSAEHVASDKVSAEWETDDVIAEQIGLCLSAKDSKHQIGRYVRKLLAQARAEERERIIDMIYQHPFHVSKVATSVKELIALIQAMV